MTTSRDVLTLSPDICRGQISWDYDRAEIIADGVVHAIGVCLGSGLMGFHDFMKWANGLS